MIMRKHSILFPIVCLIYVLSAHGQTIYSCNGLYKIELPDKLELQDSELNNVKRINVQGKKTQVIISTHSGHITFQQKGLNDNVKSAFSRYCSVIVEYFNEDRNEPTFGRGDQIVVDKDVLYFVNQAAEQSCKTSGTPLIKLVSVEAITINGFPVLYYSYKRKGWEGKQPPVIVNVFRILNRYESVILTFSYREAERELWKDIHNNILKTFSYVRRY